MDYFEHLPAVLMGTGPRGLLWWQWLSLPFLAALTGLAGVVLGRLTTWLLRKITARTAIRWDDRIVEVVAGPLSCLWAILLAFVVVGELGLPRPGLGFLYSVLRTGALIAVFWMLYRLVGLVGSSSEVAAFATARPSLRALVPLAVRVGHVAVVAIALVAVLADLGYPVASLVAGLGIGGLALALAAQKTVENLFGAFAISVDQPFTVGDTINVDGTQGEVQAIGLRSTRIRTAERTVVTLPNGRLADLKVETFAARDRLRLAAVLSLGYRTSSAQMRSVLAEIEGLLRAHPKTFQDDVVVCLKALGGYALEVEVGAYFLTTDYAEFRRIRQQMLLAFMEAVEKAGAELVLPSRTVHLVDETPPDRRPG